MKTNLDHVQEVLKIYSVVESNLDHVALEVLKTYAVMKTNLGHVLEVLKTYVVIEDNLDQILTLYQTSFDIMVIVALDVLRSYVVMDSNLGHIVLVS